MTAEVHVARGGSASRIQPSSPLARLVHGLAAKGFLVIPPAERHSNRVIRPGATLHQRVLHAFYQRRTLGQQQSPGDLTVHGLTDSEVSELLGHPDLHRRTAELRACGLITYDLDGQRASRVHRGKRGNVSVITPAGVAALRELSKEAKRHEESSH